MILLVGAILSWIAMVTYFLVIVGLPDLRDSGVPSVALAWVGTIVALAGAVRLWRTRRRRWLPTIGLAAALLPTVFLTLYIFVLSYDLPEAAASPAPGDPARPFRLPDQNGKTVALGDYLESGAAPGKWLVLDFYRGHW